MTEHSMCHPGRPSPHLLDCQAGSPGFDLAFHNAKSAGWRLPLEPVNAPNLSVHVHRNLQIVLTFTLVNQLFVTLALWCKLGIIMSEPIALGAIKLDNVKVHTSFRLVCKAVVLNLFNERDDFRYVFRDSGEPVRPEDL